MEQAQLIESVGVAVALAVAIFLLFLIVSFLLGKVFGRLAHIEALQPRAPLLQSVRKVSGRLLLVIGLLSALGSGLYSGLLIWQGTSLLAHYRAMLLNLPPDTFMQLARGLGLSLLIAIIAAVLLRMIQRTLRFTEKRAKAYGQVQANDESIEAFFGSLRTIARVTVWLAAAAWGARLVGLPGDLALGLFLLMRVYLIIAVGLLIVRAVAAVVVSLDVLSSSYTQNADNWLRYYEDVRMLVPLFRRTIEYIIYLVVATLVLLQIDSVAQFAIWGPRLIQVVGLFFLARMATALTNLIIDRTLLKPEEGDEGDLQRRLTFVPLIKSLAKYVIFFTAFVLILDAVELNPAPILAGAGIVTIVIGLGAQPLINDIVSGFFILFENIYLVGDFIETGTARGTVEAIDVRTTRIRDPNGQQHILRNGQLNEVINYSKGYTFAVVPVGVAYHSDLDQVYSVLEAVGVELEAENEQVLSPTKVDGLEDFGASELTIRTVTRVRPGHHLTVARELRRRIKLAFDQEGIEIPFAQRVLHLDSQVQELFLKQADAKGS